MARYFEGTERTSVENLISAILSMESRSKYSKTGWVNYTTENAKWKGNIAAFFAGASITVVNLDAARQEYMTAWLAYTDAVWKLVEQRREEQYRELLAQRPAPPQPIIPKHIRADIERNG